MINKDYITFIYFFQSFKKTYCHPKKLKNEKCKFYFEEKPEKT